MPKAPTVCAHPGCPELAETAGRCAAHQRQAWVHPNRRPLPPNWSKLRAQVLRRDRRTCQTCGGRATQVDHIVPRADGGTDEVSNLAAICDGCHKAKTNTEAIQARHPDRGEG